MSGSVSHTWCVWQFSSIQYNWNLKLMRELIFLEIGDLVKKRSNDIARCRYISKSYQTYRGNHAIVNKDGASKYMIYFQSAECFKLAQQVTGEVAKTGLAPDFASF